MTVVRKIFMFRNIRVTVEYEYKYVNARTVYTFVNRGRTNISNVAYTEQDTR